MLTFFSGFIKETLSDDEGLLGNLRETEKKPWVLNDEIIQRTIRLYRERLELLPIYFGQLERWRKESLHVSSSANLMKRNRI